MTTLSALSWGCSPTLLRTSHLVGRHVGPFLSGVTAVIPLASYFFGRRTLGKKLYCGNLGYDVTTLDLEKMFSQFGQVREAQVVADRDTGRSKGFGFVEMNSDAEAQAAITGLNDSMQNGRPLTVNEAKPRENRSGGGRGGYGGGRGGRY